MRCKTREVGGRLGSKQALLAGEITYRLTDGNLWGIVEEYGERAVEEAGPHAQSASVVSGFMYMVWTGSWYLDRISSLMNPCQSC